MPIQFPFHTERLILSPLTEADAQAFSAYRSDPDVARYQGWEAPYSVDQARELIAASQAIGVDEAGWHQIGIRLAETGELLGDCAYWLLKDDPRQAEIGVTLAACYQGCGYAYEALHCLISHLFNGLGLHRVRANIDPDNAGSANLLPKLGFRYEGRWVESLWFKGSYADEVWFAVLAREWK
jgi:RimJ/RimL family protein N-acetyltransferase